MVRITADQDIPFLRGVVEPRAEMDYLPARLITRETIARSDALLIRTRTRCDEALLSGTPVRFIGTATIGADHIDTGYCREHGITVVNAPGCNAGSVMQYVASVLFTLLRRDRLSLTGKQIGIVGVGNVGSRIEKLARILGMEPLLNDPPRERNEGSAGFISLQHLLRESDLVTLHVPLTLQGNDPTFHLIGREELRLMRPGTVLINTSRGEVIDTVALEASINEHRSPQAVLDVWENEPCIDRTLLQHVRIATPHIAGYSADGKANATRMILSSLVGFFGFPFSSFPLQLPPSPTTPVIRISGKGKDPLVIAAEAVLHTYDVLSDDARLRDLPGNFEHQRAHYPLRREFTAYRVLPDRDALHALSLLNALGFEKIMPSAGGLMQYHPLRGF